MRLIRKITCLRHDGPQSLLIGRLKMDGKYEWYHFIKDEECEPRWSQWSREKSKDHSGNGAFIQPAGVLSEEADINALSFKLRDSYPGETPSMGEHILGAITNQQSCRYG